MAELSSYNRIYVVTESCDKHSIAVKPSGDHLSPLIKMKALRQAIVDAAITDQKFRLLDKDKKRLKEPIFHNAQVYLEVVRS